jgi:hypothetical protein
MFRGENIRKPNYEYTIYIYTTIYIYYYTLKTCGKPKHWTAICLHLNTNLWGISQLAMFEDTGEYSLILSLEYPINIPRPHYTPVLVKPKFLI